MNDTVTFDQLQDQLHVVSRDSLARDLVDHS